MRVPVNSFEFHSCERTPQVDNLSLSLSRRPCIADSEFARLGLNYTVQGETNLIGFHAQGNYSTAVGETYAIMGMKLWAEYLDGIAKITVSAGE